MQSNEGKGAGSGVVIAPGSMDRGRFSFTAVVLLTRQGYYEIQRKRKIPTALASIRTTISDGEPASRARKSLNHLSADGSQVQQLCAEITPYKSMPTLVLGLGVSILLE